jgi:hypothetical protein
MVGQMIVEIGGYFLMRAGRSDEIHPESGQSLVVRLGSV